MTQTLIILGLAILAFAAKGQTITGASTDDRGMRIYLYLSGLNTNGTYSPGWSTNNQPLASGPKLRMRVSKPGFNSSGQAVYHDCLVYGGARVRMPYPGDAFAEEITTPGGIRITLSATDFIFASDTNLTVDVDSGIYSQGGTNSSAASGIAVTNNSIQSYPRAIAVWADGSGWDRWTNSTARVYAKGNAGQRPWPPRPETHRKPLAAMAFVAADNFGHSVTQWVDMPTIDPSLGGPLPSARYTADLTLSTFSNRSPVRLDFVAFPHLGTQGSVLSTLSNLYTGVSGLPIAKTNLYDPLNEYSSSVAIVATNGSDTTGTTTTWAGYSGHTAYFASVAKALHALRTNHNASAVWSHDDVGGGTVLVRTGDAYAWLGGSYTYGSAPAAKAIVASYPGESVTFTTQSGNTDAGDRLEVRNVTFAGSASMFNGTDYLTMRSCIISNSHASALWQTCPVVWLVDCRIPKVTGGVRPFSTQNTRFHVDRCDFSGFSGVLAPSVMLASIHPQREGGADFGLQQDTSTGGTAPTDYFYWADSFISGLQKGGTLAWWIGQNISITNGGIVENSAFFVTTNAGSSTFNLGGSIYHHTNIVIDGVAIGGARMAGYGYNQSGTNRVNREFVLHRNSIVQNLGYKTDTFTGDGPADSARVGNWPLMWGLGHRGNIHYSCNVNGGSAPEFPPYFYGLTSYHPLDVFTNSVQWIRWRDPRSQGDASVEGLGDFRLQTDSPAWDQFREERDQSLPYDLDGIPRGSLDPPGPYVSGNRKKTQAFFNQ